MKQQPVWTVEEIREMVLQGIDRDRLDALHAQAMYALTGKIKEARNWRTMGSGIWPVYLDYVPNQVETGNSRMILNSSRILLSQSIGTLEPETRGVDKVTNALRKEAWRIRSAGDGMSDGGWDLEMACQFSDFRELGAGVVFFDTLDDENDLDYTVMRHFRATDVVYDRSTRNPMHAKWVVRRTPFTRWEAFKEFGEANVSAMMLMPGGQGAYAQEIVWYYEFFSVPFAGRRETYCSFIGEMDGGKVHKTPRTSRTKCLPCSWGVNYLPAAARWPIGGVWLQAATQALLNNLEAKFRKASDRQGMTGVDLRYADDKNLRMAQETGWLKLNLDQEKEPDIRRAIMNIDGGQVSQGDLAMYEMAKRQYNEDSGLTEAMRGNLSSEERTLGENQMAQQGAEQSQSYEKRQAIAMVKRDVEKAFLFFEKFDRAPMLADLDGFDVWLNDPKDPRLSLENVFRDKGYVKIDAGSMTGDDDRLRRARRAAELSDPNVLNLVGKPGGISVEWFRDEVMKTKGEDDPNDYKMPDQPMGLGGIMGQMTGGGMPQAPAQMG